MSNENKKTESTKPFEAGEIESIALPHFIKGDAGMLQVTSLAPKSMPAEKVAKMPVSIVEWIHRDKLHGNNYNPNHVAIPELDLLERSIVEDGWTQPIVITAENEIVDGFHRWTVSGRAAVYELTDGHVPCVRMTGKSTHDRMMATIRHNRARGQHQVLKMADIVGELTRNGHSTEELEERLGMDEEEVDRLSDEASMPDRVSRDNDGFNSAWAPKAYDDGETSGGEG